MSMNPTATNAKGENTHAYPAYDYAVGIGTGLVACKDGVIVDMPGVATRQLIGNMQNGNAWPNAGGGSPNSGNVINIFHGNGEYTSYLHDSPFDVNAFRGRKVKQGEIFHKSGNNGWSTGPHLHFEVWKDGVRIDPGPWLANAGGGSVPSIINNEQARILLFSIQGKNGLYDPKNALTGSMDADIAKYFAGRTIDDVIAELWEDKTSKDYRERYQPQAQQALENQSSLPKVLSKGIYKVQ